VSSQDEYWLFVTLGVYCLTLTNLILTDHSFLLTAYNPVLPYFMIQYHHRD
jgi:hypothetical protein